MKRRAALVFLVSFFTLAPLAVSALGLQAVVPPECQGSDAASKCSICDLALVAQNLLNDGIYIAIFLSAVLFAWAGWQLVIGSSSGNVSQINQAKGIFKYVTGGLILIISAWLIVSVLMSALTNLPNWNTLCTQPIALARTTMFG